MTFGLGLIFVSFFFHIFLTRDSLFVLWLVFLSIFSWLSLVVITIVIDCLESLISEMTCYV